MEKLLEKNLMNAKQENLITIKQAAEILGVSASTVRDYIDKGKLQCIWQKRRKMVFETEVDELKKPLMAQSIFGEIVLEQGDSLRPLDCFNNVRGSYYNPLKRKTSQCYLVSYYGHIYNMDRKIERSQCKVAHDYLNVTIAQHGKKYDTGVHRLVAFVWCDNAKGKPEVHHIDGNRKNNRADNLIWVTSKEHKLADKLLGIAKDTGNFEEYNAYIEEMKQDNLCTENMHCILDSYDDEHFYFLYITDKAYKDLQRGKYEKENIPIGDIAGEFVVPCNYKRLEED